MLTERLPKFAGNRRFYLVFGILIVMSWASLIAWQRSSYAALLGHEALANHQISFANHLSTFLLSWLLMTIAMMLPASLPLLIQTQRNQTGGRWSTAQMAAGYLSTWLLFGFLAFLGDNALHDMSEPGAPLAFASDFIAPAILLTTGLYQFTPLKRRFTERCKPSTHMGIVEHAHQDGGALRLAFQLGFTCIGSCWPLMLIMFALGHHQFGWMLIIGSITAAERFSPWSIRLAQLIGAGLIAWGIITVISTI